jgi:acyl carrier protein
MESRGERMSEREQALRALIGRLTKQDTSSVGLEDDLLAELGFDSLTGLRILAGVEKHFDIQLPDDRLSEFRTIKKLMDFIEEGEKS